MNEIVFRILAALILFTGVGISTYYRRKADRESGEKVLLIWIVYVGITAGQLQGTLFGFFIGLLPDIVGGGMLGLSGLTKTLAGFFAGYFYDENRTEQTLSTWKFVVIVGILSLLHNAVYFIIFLQGTSIGWWRSLSLHGIPSALYTIILAVVPMVVFRRKYQ